jgi:CspA family cold shock protein
MAGTSPAMTSGESSFAAAGAIRLFAAYAQGTHTAIAQTQLFLFHVDANVILAKEIRLSVLQETTNRAAACGVMASDGIPKGLGLGPQAAGEIADEASVSVIELSGVIKWFDVSKGYGFIVPDNGLPDVLLHVTCLRRDGYQAAYEGARVVVEALQRPRGLQCFRILSMDESTAIHPSILPPARTHVTVTPTSGLERAQVKWFNRLRGFGFLTRGEGTPDIFVHMETLRRFGITELRPGQIVLVRYGPGPKGLMAAEVRPDGGPHGPASH